MAKPQESEDEDDLAVDYSVLFTNKSRDPSNLLRGTAADAVEEVQTEGDALETSLRSLKLVLEEDRVVSAKQAMHAKLETPYGVSSVSEPRGNHLKSAGTSAGPVTMLLPEETLYLMEQNALVLTSGGAPVSMQQAYSIVFGGKGGEGGEKRLTLEEFAVYGYLKRLGYVVRRHQPRSEGALVPASAARADQSNGLILRRHWIDVVARAWKLWTWLYGRLTTLLGSFFRPRTPQSVYPQLQIVPRFTGDPPSGQDSEPPAMLPTFDVYKPSTPFRRKDPGPPDYHVAVVKPSSGALSLRDVRSLLSRRREGDKARTVVALVDGGNVSFIGLDSAPVKVEKQAAKGVVKRGPQVAAPAAPAPK
ncbi:hypothetical protein DFJ74DRAFT_701960 [Hyaloraphidium curvatum]|nr:hypothetical protein DFJ74DRAFT_701960 [Hyaloraphidium curvatum]